ncbi:MAG TPA: VanZ family protein [Fulvivirga sp.]|nr:VanZ family protein [Fulvivirga sp.]
MNKYLIAAILWAILILVLTLTPGASVPNYKLFSYDHLGHLAIFSILAFLMSSGIYAQKQQMSKSIQLSLLPAIIYGMVIEVIQEYIPGRSMEWLDLLANCSGSILGISLFYISIKKNWQ